MSHTIQRIAIKVGSNVITKSNGLPDQDVITHISHQVDQLIKKGIQVILISSGAVAAGRSNFQFKKKTDTVSQRQVLSSLGQIKLISIYSEVFQQSGNTCSQVLVTKEDFRSRTHYLNMKNCFEALLLNNVVPIVNENDAVSITELMFTDNDELAGLVSAMMNVDALFILTNVHGIYDGDPEKGGKVISEFDAGIHKIDAISGNGKKSEFGRGGILTKCHTAQKIAKMGIKVHIAHGKENNLINRVLDGEKIGTTFLPKKAASNLKKWIAHSHDKSKGQVFVNDGAKNSLQSNRATSLLPVGVTDVKGNFKRGDIVTIFDDNENMLGIGMVRYGYKKAREKIGMKNQKPIIHYDHLYLY